MGPITEFLNSGCSEEHQTCLLAEALPAVLTGLLEPSGKNQWPRGASALATAGACARVSAFALSGGPGSVCVSEFAEAVSGKFRAQSSGVLTLGVPGGLSCSEEVLKAGKRVGVGGKRPSRFGFRPSVP